MTWADIAREVFAARGADPAEVTDVTTAEYARGKTWPLGRSTAC